jgi:hypothetical protein
MLPFLYEHQLAITLTCLVIGSLVVIFGLMLAIFPDGHPSGWFILLFGLAISAFGFSVNGLKPDKITQDKTTGAITYKLDGEIINHTPSFPSIREGLEYFQKLSSFGTSPMQTYLRLGKTSYTRSFTVTWQDNSFSLKDNDGLVLTTFLPPLNTTPTVVKGNEVILFQK